MERVGRHEPQEATAGCGWQWGEMGGGETGWMEEQSRNAVAVEKPPEARQGAGRGDGTGGGKDDGRNNARLV